MLLAPARDRIVGTAFQDGPVPDEWADAAADLPSISDFMPSEEVVLDLEPDLVYSGWESAFAPDAAGDRAELASLGVASYVQPAACRSADVPAKLTFDEVFREIEEVAGISGRRQRADRRAEGALAAISPMDRGLTALVLVGRRHPVRRSRHRRPQLVLDAVGSPNIAGDIDHLTLGWEPIVDANPDVIVPSTPTGTLRARSRRSRRTRRPRSCRRWRTTAT